MTAPPPVKHNPELHDLVWDLVQKEKPGTLLDVPSGPGYFAQVAAQHGFQAVAAEIDSALHVLPGVQYVKANMGEQLPFADSYFDCVVSIEGIEHTENPFRFLRECARVLKPNGKLFLTTPNVSSLQNRLLFLITGSHDNPPGPIRSDLPDRARSGSSSLHESGREIERFAARQLPGCPDHHDKESEGLVERRSACGGCFDP